MGSAVHSRDATPDPRRARASETGAPRRRLARRARRCCRRPGLAAVSATLCRPVRTRGLTDAHWTLGQRQPLSGIAASRCHRDPSRMTEVSMEAYTLSIVGVLALCLLSILLAIYSGSSKGR